MANLSTLGDEIRLVGEKSPVFFISPEFRWVFGMDKIEMDGSGFNCYSRLHRSRKSWAKYVQPGFRELVVRNNSEICRRCLFFFLEMMVIHYPSIFINLLQVYMGGFPKWWYPTTIGFLTIKLMIIFGVFWGHHHLIIKGFTYCLLIVVLWNFQMWWSGQCCKEICNMDSKWFNLRIIK